MNKFEYRLKNYLNQHQIYGNFTDMQTVIINSFYTQRGKDNEDDWKDKCKYCVNHFGLFSQYANNEWKINGEKFVSILKKEFKAISVTFDSNVVEVIENQYTGNTSRVNMNYRLTVLFPENKKYIQDSITENDFPFVISRIRDWLQKF